MIKKILAAIICIAIISVGCSRKPYVEHKLKLSNTDKDCSQAQSSFRMVSNFGGERYEFEKCLPSGFSEEGLTSERRGDTVVVRFQRSGNQPGNKVYQVTLDIDSYPRYHAIEIDGEVYPISAEGNK